MVTLNLANWKIGMWKNIFFVHAIKKVLKGTYVEIKNDFQNMFKFYQARAKRGLFTN